MLKKTICLLMMFISQASIVKAGTVTDGVWSPSTCGAKPIIPVIKQATVEDYNKSITVINEWQRKANNFTNCLINEANADNALIAKTANEQQKKFKLTVDNIKSHADVAKANLSGEPLPQQTINSESTFLSEEQPYTPVTLQKAPLQVKPLNLEEFKTQCKELGFKKGTADYGNCVLQRNESN